MHNQETKSTTITIHQVEEEVLMNVLLQYTMKILLPLLVVFEENVSPSTSVAVQQ